MRSGPSQHRSRAALLRRGWLTLLWLPACASIAAPGPLAVRNQHPAQLLVMAQPPRSAAAVPPGDAEVRLTADYTSLFLGERTPARSFVMDGEVLRTALAVRLGVLPGIDLEAELPTVHAAAGFLDALVLDYHRAFGLPQSGRTQASKGRYDVHASAGGVTGFALTEHGLHLADVPLLLHAEVLRESATQPGLAVRTGVELPTGSAADGTGNGRVDVSLGAEAEWHLVGLGWSLGAFHTVTGGSGRARQAGFPLQDVTGAHAGVEVPLLRGWQLLAETTLETSTLRALDLRRTDRAQWLLAVGTRIGLLPGVTLEGSFSEDLLPDISPDFSARAALTLRLPVSPETP